MSDLVGNPEDRFSHDAAQIKTLGWLSLVIKVEGSIECLFFGFLDG